MKGEGEVIKNCYGSMYVSVEQESMKAMSQTQIHEWIPDFLHIIYTLLLDKSCQIINKLCRQAE